MLHTYNGTSPPPTKPNVPPRPTPTGFPPPPRPPPAAAPKSQYPPPPSGAQKYARFNRPESASTWGSSGTDYAKAKTNDYKAWEQMKHGQGPIPRRTVPPKAPRAATFLPGREPNGGFSRDSNRGRAEWERFQDGMPGITRSNTSRVSPKRSGFAPSTPGGDESQAPSAYFNVSRGERPNSSRAQTNMPPPPSPAPTKKKPDPLQSVRDRMGVNEPFGNKSRLSTPYKTSGGERTYFASPGLQRSATSATPRDTNNRNGLYETPQARAASAAAANHNGKSSAEKKEKNVFSGYTSSSSSNSSSDEDEQPYASAKPRVTQLPKSRRTRMPAGAHRQTGFNPFARVEDAGDEPMAPQAGLGDGYYTGPRRHSAIDLDSQKTSGFEEHRAEHNAGKSQQQSAGGSRDLPDSQRSDGSQPALSRSKSWQERMEGHKEKWGSPPKDKDHRSATDDQNNRTPMYASQGYNPFSSTKSPPPNGPPTPLSDKWCEQWPFKSPQRPRTQSAERPPYWAIPSCLPPIMETDAQKIPDIHCPLQSRSQRGLSERADADPIGSFNIPKYTDRPSAGTTPIRSRSTENIDTNFSPDGYQPKFFEPSPISRTATPLRTVSPGGENTVPHQQQTTGNVQDFQGGSSKPSSTTIPPPPPPVGSSYSPERWAAHLEDLNFEMQQPPQGRSCSKPSMRKRPRTQASKATNAQPTVNDAEEEPTATSATGDSSKTNNDVDAMDLDEPTPPRATATAGEEQANGPAMSPKQPNGTITTPRQAPTLPPRANVHKQSEADPPHLNLGDLKNVYPFGPSNEGLGNMNDMATNLPFESRASPTKPSANIPALRQGLPRPPKFPFTPPNLTSSSCGHYLRQLRSYMDAWNSFNTDMVQVLGKRQAFIQESSNCNWLDIKGSGYEDYMKGLEEHKRARVHLETAYDHHEENMKNLGLVRDEIIRGRGGAGRKPSDVGDMLQSLF